MGKMEGIQQRILRSVGLVHLDVCPKPSNTKSNTNAQLEMRQKSAHTVQEKEKQSLGKNSLGGRGQELLVEKGLALGEVGRAPAEVRDFADLDVAKVFEGKLGDAVGLGVDELWRG